MKLDQSKVLEAISQKLIAVGEKEVIVGPDDIPMALNILKLLEIYETGDFYGTLSIRILGVSPRNIKITERSFRLVEEKSEFFLDKD